MASPRSWTVRLLRFGGQDVAAGGDKADRPLQQPEGADPDDPTDVGQLRAESRNVTTNGTVISTVSGPL